MPCAVRPGGNAQSDLRADADGEDNRERQQREEAEGEPEVGCLSDQSQGHGGAGLDREEHPGAGKHLLPGHAAGRKQAPMFGREDLNAHGLGDPGPIGRGSRGDGSGMVGSFSGAP